jgi:hypothetical protein
MSRSRPRDGCLTGERFTVAEKRLVSNPMSPTTPPTTAMSTNTAMMVRRTQRGGRPGATSRDHELV